MLGDIHPIANGLGTDHPIPDLPFVDDSHIPLDDPYAIEAVGRHAGTDMWGREDRCSDGGWVAFTTDPIRHDLGWCVRWHPEHGRTVALFRDDDAITAHQAWSDTALLHRAGGYWWDGTGWYRPSQLYDPAALQYLRKKVPAAVTVSAADLLQAGTDPTAADVLTVADVDPDAPPRGRWADHLALWAARHDNRRRPLTDCVVQVSAPELAGDQLVTVAELAQIAGISASTLRAYLSRDEADVPPPQVMVSGRAMWSRPVAEDWAELRRTSSEGLEASLAVDVLGSGKAPGVADLYQRFARSFFYRLWEGGRRKRWALRWRTKEAVQEIAQSLSWEVAASLPRIVPLPDLGVTLEHAILHELIADHAKTPGQPCYGITPAVERMLAWLVRHDLDQAATVMQHIVGAAEGQGIPREVTIRTLSTALHLDRKITDPTGLNDYLDRVFAQVRANAGQ